MTVHAALAEHLPVVGVEPEHGVLGESVREVTDELVGVANGAAIRFGEHVAEERVEGAGTVGVQPGVRGVDKQLRLRAVGRGGRYGMCGSTTNTQQKYGSDASASHVSMRSLIASQVMNMSWPCHQFTIRFSVPPRSTVVPTSPDVSLGVSPSPSMKSTKWSKRSSSRKYRDVHGFAVNTAVSYPRRDSRSGRVSSAAKC
nr:hypothetical protein [Salinigranum rubrum]